jgi:hypothetical protein
MWRLTRDSINAAPNRVFCVVSTSATLPGFARILQNQPDTTFDAR